MSDETAETPKRPAILGSNWKLGGLGVAALLVIWQSPYLYSLFSERAASCHHGMVSDVVKLSKENKEQSAGIWIVDLVETKDTKQTNKLIACSGIAILSNATKQPIVYQAYEEYDKWWIKYELE